MIKLEGKIFKGNIVIASAVVELPLDQRAEYPYLATLEKCFLVICKELNITIPIWVKKNTKEFARFRQTVFYGEQFLVDVNFDRFQIKELKR